MNPSVAASALDAKGYRPNVGIVVINHDNKVWWGKRVRQNSWQFPQGGVHLGENVELAMFRELNEEIGLQPQHVKILGRTRRWLHYDVPMEMRRHDKGNFKGQKQIWFLLRFLGEDNAVNLQASAKPEFDAWCWSDYWSPLDQVVNFKRKVYQQALQELFHYVDQPLAPVAATRPQFYLRRRMRSNYAR